jgi:hypothetical protein
MLGGLVFTALLILLGIETVRAWEAQARSRLCRICGRKIGLWHVEKCHKWYQFSPGTAITIILVVIGLILAIVLVSDMASKTAAH